MSIWRQGGKVWGTSPVCVWIWECVGPFARRSLHALLEDRVAAGLADKEVGPLHHHDADKEGCVASELHHLSLLIGLGEDR